jgi:hypothetical protein
MSQVHQLILLLNGTPKATAPITAPAPAAFIPTVTTTTTASTPTKSTAPSQPPAPAVSPTVLQIHNMLLYVCTELNIQETEKAVAKWRSSIGDTDDASSSSAPISSSPSRVPSLLSLPISPAKAKPVQLLSRVGKFLELVFKHKPPISRIVGKDIIGKGSRYLFDEVWFYFILYLIYF